jgi:hypothetical protein
LVAEALAKPLKGCDAIITDGSQCYDNVRSYRCLWHKMKNFPNTDPFLYRVKHSTKTLKEGAPHRSFTNTNTTFNCQKIMGRTIAGQPVETYMYH